MSDTKDSKDLPSLSDKPAASKKLSVFERQKAEAEAKRLREEAETAAVLKDFERSFEGDDTANFDNGGVFKTRIEHSPEVLPPTGSARRHFTTSAHRNSGPGTLGPPGLPRKRGYDGSTLGRDRDRGVFAFEDSTPAKSRDTSSAFRTSDDEDEQVKDSRGRERAPPKPTLQLSSLPPSTSELVIRKLLPDTLKVDSVRILPPSGPGATNSVDRKSMTVIVAFAQDTPGSELDAAVSSMQNKYLGWGYYLSLSRHLSSAVLSSMSTSSLHTPAALASFPFGAQPIVANPLPSLSRAPPPGPHRGGFAPPISYNQPDFGRGMPPPPLQVKVLRPTDLNQLKLIQKTAEAVISSGTEFEAALMKLPAVQRHEKWAWIWNPRSQGGIWYRWRLWQLLARTNQRRPGQRKSMTRKLFEGGFPWLEPEDSLPFEFLTQFDGIVSASDYDSSAEDDSDEEGLTRRRKREFDGPAPLATSTTIADDEQIYLRPLDRAKFTHLLHRLPTSIGTLRRGDVARITAFAITHASVADEIVAMLISNVFRPTSVSGTKSNDQKENGTDKDIDMGEAEDKYARGGKDAQQDHSGSTLIGLYLISDILSASSTSGMRHAWRYRAHFETAFQNRNMFAWLGRIEKDLGWGRLRAEKWRRSISIVFQTWEDWCVFPSQTHKEFVEQFNDPPLTGQDLANLDKKIEKNGPRDAAKSKWKTVDANTTAQDILAPSVDQLELMDTMKDYQTAHAQKARMAAESSMNNARLHEVSINGQEDKSNRHVDQASKAKDLGGTALLKPEPASSANTTVPEVISTAGVGTADQPQSLKRRRPKAIDMFADSDEED